MTKHKVIYAINNELIPLLNDKWLKHGHSATVEGIANAIVSCAKEQGIQIAEIELNKIENESLRDLIKMWILE